MSIRLSSSDNQEFIVRKEIAIQSVFIENMIYESDSDIIVPLPNVNGKTLKKIIEWCDHHSSNNKDDDDDDWDQQFFSQMEQDTLFDVILGANYLDIEGLVTASCQSVASQIKGMDPKEMRETFNIVGAFTPEEEAQIRQENDWYNDNH